MNARAPAAAALTVEHQALLSALLEQPPQIRGALNEERRALLEALTARLDRIQSDTAAVQMIARALADPNLRTAHLSAPYQFRVPACREVPA